MSVEKLVEKRSDQYIEMRVTLRRRARDYALERVGGSKQNQRARSMLAAAFDAGVSVMVGEVRAALAKDRSTDQTTESLTDEERETIQALRDGTAKIIAVLSSERLGGRAEGSDGRLDGRTEPLGRRASSGEGSVKVATVEPESERENSESAWSVGDYCVWRLHPHFGPAELEWISGGTGKPSSGHAGSKRCKLYYKALNRTEDAWLDDLEWIGEQ
jgi:hypothetical protein